MHALTSAKPASPRSDQIVDAARRLFVQYGYRRTQMSDIAREAGIAKATLYLHFNSKEQVFRAMIDRCRAVVAERMAAAERLQAPAAEALAALLDAQFGTALEWFGEASHLAELRAFLIEEGDDLVHRGERDLRKRLRMLLEARLAAGEIDLARSGLALDEVVEALLQGAAGAKSRRSGSYEEAVLRLARLAVAGLAR